jgi:hypothetical protein
MPHFDRIHPSLAEPLWTEEGHFFKGAISQVQNKDVAASKEFLFSRRRMFVGRHTDFVVPGTVVRNGMGRRFLAADDGEGYYQGVLYRQFRLIEMEKHLDHIRRGDVIDPVTKLKKEGVAVNLGRVWCALEPHTNDEDQIRIEASRFRVVTGTVLLKNDKLGDFIVQDVNERLGIYVAVVSDGS